MAGKPGRDPLAAFGLASAMDEVEYQSYLTIAVCLDAIQEQQGSWRAPAEVLAIPRSLPGQGTVGLRSPRWQAGQIAQHSLSAGADSPPAAGTGRRALTQMGQRRRRYGGVSCWRRALTLPGSGRLAG